MAEWVVYKEIGPTTYRAQVLEHIYELLLRLSRIGVGFTPYVGAAVDLYEVVTGRGFFDGARLTPTERVITAAGFLAGQGANLRAIEKAILPELKNAPEVRQVLEAASAEAHVLGAENVGHYGPWNPGPLYKEEVGKNGMKVIETFRSSTYLELKTTQPEKLYRVYDGNPDRELTHFWSESKPTGPLQATLDSALTPGSEEYGNPLGGDHCSRGDDPIQGRCGGGL